MLEVTPEMLRWDIYVDAFTNTTAPTINAVDREQKLQFTNAVWTIVQWYALSKQAGFDIDTVLPLKETISSLAEDFNLNPSNKEDTQDIDQAKKGMMEQLMGMKRRAAAPQWNPQMPAEQWAPQQAPQWPEWEVNPAEQAQTQNAPQLKNF